MPLTDSQSDMHSFSSWSPIVIIVLQFLVVAISVGKQFLNNKKHTDSNQNLTGLGKNIEELIKMINPALPDVPENLKGSDVQIKVQ